MHMNTYVCVMGIRYDIATTCMYTYMYVSMQCTCMYTYMYILHVYACHMFIISYTSYSGAFGIVYKGVTTNGVEIAIKTLKGECLYQPGLLLLRLLQDYFCILCSCQIMICSILFPISCVHSVPTCTCVLSIVQ